MAPSQCGSVTGRIPPPIAKRPPTPTRPDSALVTDMSGEWSAGVTLQTARKPTRPARPSVLNMVMNAGLVTAPRPRTEPIPTDAVVTDRTLSCQGVRALTSCWAI
jgi:hypothetical protein